MNQASSLKGRGRLFSQPQGGWNGEEGNKVVGK